MGSWAEIPQIERIGRERVSRILRHLAPVLRVNISAVDQTVRCLYGWQQGLGGKRYWGKRVAASVKNMGMEVCERFFKWRWGWWRKSVLHVGREEILRRQGCGELEVVLSKRDEDGVQGVGPVCVGWWRRQKILRR